VDSERLLRNEFRRALDEVLPPAPWLEAAVTEDFRKRRSRGLVDRTLGVPQRSKSLARAPMQLAATVLVLVLAAATAVAFLAFIYHGPQSAPAGAVSIEAYQAMLSRDDGMANVSRGNNCVDLQSACPAPPGPLATTLQRWLDDLNRSDPPARFAVIDAQMRLHLAASISDLDAVFLAYQARDENGLLLANQAASNQQHWLDIAAKNIAESQPGTAATYIASVRVAYQTFDGCAACQSLLAEVDCTEIKSWSCEYAVIRAGAPVEALQIAPVRVSAPPSLSAQDARLQNDLAKADDGVLAMATARVTGDQAAFDAARLMLQQALLAINADVARVLNP
jgi:hypothetical protein